MEVMTTAEIESYCDQLSQMTYIYYPVSQYFFRDLYNTGCRPMELLTVDRWTIDEEGNYILQPLKDNAPRLFTPDQLSEDLKFSIENQVRPYQSLSLRQLKSVLQKLTPLLKIQTDDKSAVDYIFRYNRVKQFQEAGKTYEEIRAIFGWSTALMALTYAQKVIYKIGTIPPPPTDLIIDSEGNYVIDSDGNFLTG